MPGTMHTVFVKAQIRPNFGKCDPHAVLYDSTSGLHVGHILALTISVTMQVFLSATLSNASQFARWITHLHKQPCHVVYTDYRPTPLQHYAFPVGGSGLFLVRSVLTLGGCRTGGHLVGELCSTYRFHIT
jgi:hypothetical protein